MSRTDRFLRSAGLLPLALFVVASAICGVRLDGYSHRVHPLALLGAAGVPGAAIFNAAALIVPGVLAAAVSWALRSNLAAGARWQGRIGLQLAMLSGLAFAAQGMLPLNPDDIGGAENGLHALAWTAWWMSYLAGAVLLLSGRPTRALMWATAATAMAVPVFALAPWSGAMAAFAPRLAFVAWLLWVAVAPRCASQPD